MVRQILLLVGVLSIVGGCASEPDVRSEVFVDGRAIRNIYVMPIVTEVTLDSDCAIPRSELQSKLALTRSQIAQAIRDQLACRGYGVSGQAPAYDDLSSADPAEERIRSGVRAFLTPPASANFEETFAEAIARAIVAGRQPATRPVELSPRALPDPLIAATLATAGSLPPGTDSVLFVHIQSRIAPRGWFGSLQDQSTLSVSMKLVSLSHQRVVYRSDNRRENADVLEGKRTIRSVAECFNTLPVKL